MTDRGYRVQLTTQPSEIIDDDLFEEMEILEKLIAYHKKHHDGMDGRYGKMEMPVPREIEWIISTSLQTEWDKRNYDIVRVLWAEAWMIFYQSFYDMPPSFEANDYAGYGSDPDNV